MMTVIHLLTEQLDILKELKGRNKTAGSPGKYK